MKPIYWGIFLPTMEGCLERKIQNQHVTFGFKSEYPEKLHGKHVEIVVTGYGNDGQNEAYSVYLPYLVMQYYNGAKVPHITVSTSKDGKPVDSWKLKFEPIDDPFILTGRIGYFDEDGVHV